MSVNRLVELRQKYGFTQLDLANRLQMAKCTYNQKENGRRAFKPDEMVKIYELFRQYDDSLNMQDIFLSK